ncbi:MAG: molybdenum cofactor guanylyltransferase [Verrucomicrobia bacterium]|nr:molybdenum cofactor guanylyltransferase [Verrucomicrobiota bacterium]
MENGNEEVGLAFSGVLLAGGRSTRMGRDKARLAHPRSGLPMVEHQVELLRAAGCAECFLAVRAETDYPEIGAEITRLFDDGASGPLGAIAVGLARAREARVMVLAVDMPGVTAEWVCGLVARATPECGVVVRGAAGCEPLCTVYPAMAAGAFAKALTAGRLSLQPLVAAGVAEGWLREVSAPEDEAVLANWNAPKDLG